MPDEKKDVKRRRPLLRSLSWIFLVAAAAVIGYYAVQGSHGTAAAAVCEAKFLTQPEETSPGSSDWAAYGVTQLNVMPGRSFSIEPAPDLYTDEWFGAALSSPGTCDYRVDFDAEVTGPLHPDAAAMLGYGYSVGARGNVINGVPQGVTVQFDIPFGGLRTVELPGQANAAGLNAHLYRFVGTGHYHHWTLTVRGVSMLVSVDGERYGPVDLSRASGGELILRVWDARLYVRNVRTSKLRPW